MDSPEKLTNLVPDSAEVRDYFENKMNIRKSLE